MEYIIADREKARNWGFSEVGHIVRGNLICLNEKEIMNSLSLEGSLKERAEQLGGWVTSMSEAKMVMNNSI
jgi:hypothetical protein